VASRVLIVEADRDLIRTLEAELRSGGFEVVVARNGVEALRAMQAERPDFVILDPTLAWLGGERIRHAPRPGSRVTGPPIIVLHAGTEESERIPPLGVAAENSVTRLFDSKEVLRHVKALQQRSASASGGGILRAGVMEMDLERWTVAVQGRIVTLTAKEFGLLRMLFHARGRVLTRDALREVAWQGGREHGFDSRTLDVHIGRLRRKLGPAGRYILTVRGVGYRFAVPPERTHSGDRDIQSSNE